MTDQAPADEKTTEAPTNEGPTAEERHQERRAEESEPEQKDGSSDEQKPAEGAEDQGGSEKEEGGEEGSSEGDGGEEPSVPESADGYDLTLPDVGLKDEKGEAFQLSPDDPLAAKLKQFAHEHSWTKESVTGLMALYAESMKSQSDAMGGVDEKRAQGELSKLQKTDADGKIVTGQERVTALLQSLDAKLGEGASSKMTPAITSADVVLQLEKLVSLTGEAAASPKGSTRSLEGLSAEDRLIARRSEG